MQDLTLQLPLLLRVSQPGVLGPQLGQLLGRAPAGVAALGRRPGLFLADPRPQRLGGDAEIRATAAYVRLPPAAR